MARGSQNLELQVLRNGRREDKFDDYGDPEDLRWLAGLLRGWLQRQRWHENRWNEFEITARPRDGGPPTRTGV